MLSSVRPLSWDTLWGMSESEHDTVRVTQSDTECVVPLRDYEAGDVPPSP